MTPHLVMVGQFVSGLYCQLNRYGPIGISCEVHAHYERIADEEKFLRQLQMKLAELR